MDQETANYIVNHFSDLLTPTEKLSFKHMSSLIKLGLDSGSTDKAALINTYKKIGWLTNDENALLLVAGGADALNLKTAKRIMNESGENIFLNYCPKCNRLARTPAAKQCRHCSYDWHGKS